jgi:hypothetical protein
MIITERFNPPYDISIVKVGYLVLEERKEIDL